MLLRTVREPRQVGGGTECGKQNMVSELDC